MKELTAQEICEVAKLVTGEDWTVSEYGIHKRDIHALSRMVLEIGENHDR
jgi:hypothetical protein